MKRPSVAVAVGSIKGKKVCEEKRAAARLGQKSVAKRPTQPRTADDIAARAFSRTLRELIMTPLACCVRTKQAEITAANSRFTEQGMRNNVWKNREQAQRIAGERAVA